VGALSTTREGHYRALSPIVGDEVVKEVNGRVDNGWTLAYTAFGDGFQMRSFKIPAKPEDLEFWLMFWELFGGFLGVGKVNPVREDLNRGG
jgi:hypothetical protein